MLNFDITIKSLSDDVILGKSHVHEDEIDFRRNFGEYDITSRPPAKRDNTLIQRY